jgi:hypothetical protein
MALLSVSISYENIKSYCVNPLTPERGAREREERRGSLGENIEKHYILYGKREDSS